MAGIGRVLSDRKTHASNAGGIRAGKVVAMLQLNLGRDLDLATQVHKERAVGNLANRKTVQSVNRCGDRYGVGDVAGVAANVDHQHCRVGLGHVERGDGSPGLGDDNRQPCYCSRFGGRFDANGDGIRRAGRGHGVVFLYVTSVSGELATAVG
jgi:hypothetical protein